MTIGEKAGVTQGLHLVAVPIGNARDITLRALDTLAGADVLAAEDTRSLRRLMEIHGVALGGRPLLPYHDHNGARMRPRLLQALQDGKSVAYASEAGTPLVSDPGFDLVRAAQAQGSAVTAVPGASAVLAALVVAGMPTDRFLFAGFLPSAAGARQRALRDLAEVPATLVLYESAKRLAATLAAAWDVLGDRPAVVCRELTKRFEEARPGTLSELAQTYASAPPKGEIVLVIGKGTSEKISDSDLDSEIRRLQETMSVRDLASELATRHGLPRRDVYQRAMKLAQEDS